MPTYTSPTGFSFVPPVGPAIPVMPTVTSAPVFFLSPSAISKAEVNGLNEKVVKMLAERKMTVSAAESCTGGLFAALITNVSGASEVLNESFVTYANSAKMKYLGVKGETLEKHGAVIYAYAPIFPQYAS